MFGPTKAAGAVMIGIVTLWSAPVVLTIGDNRAGTRMNASDRSLREVFILVLLFSKRFCHAGIIASIAFQHWLNQPAHEESDNTRLLSKRQVLIINIPLGGKNPTLPPAISVHCSRS